MRAISRLHTLASNRRLMGVVVVGAVSRAGDWLYLTALPVLIYEATGDAALVGLAAAGRLLPFFALSMPAGLVADRVPPRTLLLAGEVVRCLAMLVIAGLCWAGGNVALIIALATGAAAAGTFSLPAEGALRPRLAADDAELGRANAISSTLDGLASMIGPGVAGLLIATGGLPVAFVINGASFALVIVVLACLAPPGARSRRAPGDAPTTYPAAGVDRGVGAGPASGPLPLGSVVRQIGPQLALDAAISFSSGALGVLGVIVATELLGTGDWFTGALNAGLGLGGILGGLVAGGFVNRAGRGGVATGLAITVPALAGLAMAHSPGLAIGLLAAAGGALVLLDRLNLTAIQRLAGNGGTGRALGVTHTLSALAMMGGSLLPAAVVGPLGPTAAMLSVATVVAALGALAWFPLPIARARPSVAAAVPAP